MADKKTQPWKCPDCPQKFATEDERSEHYLKSHPVPEVDPSFYDDDSWTVIA
jgi:hypothetical protein